MGELYLRLRIRSIIDNFLSGKITRNDAIKQITELKDLLYISSSLELIKTVEKILRYLEEGDIKAIRKMMNKKPTKL
ncbi:MAG: hypothetical protein DRN30_02850 [Thermoplasmata archaeon]|nr:hypothetical protein [Euryarchaeota archaeon]RLF66063.1 MAG: hypothetical protein DRN30_02850 [Thermoplasmata archaeon]